MSNDDVTPKGTQKLPPFGAEFLNIGERVVPFHMDDPDDGESIPWVIELKIEDENAVVRTEVVDATTIGRGSGPGASDIDLSVYGGLEAGVSRRHAIILARKKFLSIRDLNSTNGTFINGLRLMPQQDVPLEHNDELQFGHLRTRVHFAVVPPNKLASPDDLREVDTAPAYQGKGKQVLVLDTDPDTRRIYQAVLVENGYRVITTADPTEAAAIFAEDKPSAVVMDLFFHANDHGSDGMDVLRLMRHRAIQENKQTPLIVVSSVHEARVAQQARRAGATQVLRKPIPSDDLVRRVTQTIADDESSSVGV
jgi:CheY-like chemotaxis protein